VHDTIDDFEAERLMHLLRNVVIEPRVRGHFGAALFSRPLLGRSE